MLGFIKKDILMIKSNFKALAILFVIYIIMAFQGSMDLSFILLFMSVMIMVSTFSYDNYNKWDAYAVTLPDGRKKCVQAKYLATIILVILSTLIVTVLSIAIAYYKTRDIDYEGILSNMFGAVFAATVLQSFIYPAIYKFGIEKARIGIFVIIFGVAVICSLIVKFVDFRPVFQLLDVLNNYWIIILPVIMILLLYTSYKISDIIYKKKEY